METKAGEAGERGQEERRAKMKEDRRQNNEICKEREGEQ